MAESSKILLVGPFVGELGWECFTFQPIVRKKFDEGFDKCIVYTCPGSSLLYPFAETREFDRPKGLESACNGTMSDETQIEKHRKLLEETLDAFAKELAAGGKPAEVAFLTGLGLPRCDLMLGMGSYIKVESDGLRIGPAGEVQAEYEPDKKTVVLCIRDRSLSDFRNWGYPNWKDLANELANLSYNVVAVGRVADDEMLDLPDGVWDYTNATTIDDCIRLFHLADLMVGGSSGTMHLASRCGRPHLVWGLEDNTDRYRETNFHHAEHKVYEWGWSPEVKDVVEAVDHYLSIGEFK